MRKRLLYVELKSGHNHDGPAWIGYGTFNRTGKTVYFNGKAYSKMSGSIGNFYSGDEEYWVTGIKQNAAHRHQHGRGKIFIDGDAVNEYQEYTRQDKLPKSKYEIVSLDNTIPENYHIQSNKPL